MRAQYLFALALLFSSQLSFAQSCLHLYKPKSTSVYLEEARQAYQQEQTQRAHKIEDHIKELLRNEEILEIRKMPDFTTTETYLISFASGLAGVFKPRPEFWRLTQPIRAKASNDAAEVLAYKLSRRLALNFVPVTVIRQIGRMIGSFQCFAYNDKSPPLPQEQKALEIFDYLINNHDRYEHNSLTQAGHIIAIDHGIAFVPDGGIGVGAEAPKSLEQLSLENTALQQKFYRELKSLSDHEIQTLMQDFFEQNLIQEFINRRDLLLKRYEQIFSDSSLL